MSPPGSSRVRRTILGYVVVTIVAALALGAVLWRGAGLQPAPVVAPVLATGAMAPCLGDAVITTQSGVFLDLHVPGPAGEDAVAGELGMRLLRGRLGAPGEVHGFSGSCIDGSRIVADLGEIGRQT